MGLALLYNKLDSGQVRRISWLRAKALGDEGRLQMCTRIRLVLGGVCVGAVLVMAYLHRGMIVAAIKGEEMPEAPKGCPAYKGEE